MTRKISKQIKKSSNDGKEENFKSFSESLRILADMQESPAVGGKKEDDVMMVGANDVMFEGGRGRPRGRGRGGFRGRSRGRGVSGCMSAERSAERRHGACWGRGKRGHFARDCYQQQKLARLDQGKAVEEEDGELRNTDDEEAEDLDEMKFNLQDLGRNLIDSSCQRITFCV